MNRDWHGAQGLVDDIHYYGKWMRDEAERRIGHLYPKVTLPKEYGGGEATVIAWLWARTVTCPNPACGVQMPLTNKWWLSKKKGKEAWIEPKIDYNTAPPTIKFLVNIGKGYTLSGTVNRQGATCIACNTPVTLTYIRSEAQSGRMRTVLLSIVAESQRGRLYIASDNEQIDIALSAKPNWKPEELVTTPSHDVDRLPMYGMYKWGDAFTARQLVALTTFSDLVHEAREKILLDMSSLGIYTENTNNNLYADAITTYLGINVSRLANRCSTLCFWDSVGENVQQVFARQAITMIWDFVEGNPFSTSTGNFIGQIDYMTSVIGTNPYDVDGFVEQKDSSAVVGSTTQSLISTDPPYYDNISYADLSDFFYIWLRRSLN